MRLLCSREGPPRSLRIPFVHLVTRWRSSIDLYSHQADLRTFWIVFMKVMHIHLRTFWIAIVFTKVITFADILNFFHEGHHIWGHFELFSRRSSHLKTFWTFFTKVITFADILNFFHEGHHIFADILNFFHICGHFKLFFTKVIIFADILLTKQHVRRFSKKNGDFQKKTEI